MASKITLSPLVASAAVRFKAVVLLFVVALIVNRGFAVTV